MKLYLRLFIIIENIIICIKGRPYPRPPPKYVAHLGPPLIFSRRSTKDPDKSPLYKFSLNCSHGFLFGGFVFCLEGFVRCGFYLFPLLSEHICYDRKLNITLNFMFHMYDIGLIFISVTSHTLYLLPCHKLSHLLTPLPPRRDVDLPYGRPLSHLCLRFEAFGES